jgi:hypothetical protein
MHIDPTLDIFDDVTIRLGAAFRHFVDVICVDFDTRELAREEGQRKRREAKRKDRTSQNTTANTPATTSMPLTPVPSDGVPAAPPHAMSPVSGAQQNPTPSTNPKFSNTAGTSSRKKMFTLNTYKYHACGDYPNTIRRYGTADSYSTEIVSHSLF